MFSSNHLSYEERELLDKINDKIMICQKREIITYTDFLNPYQVELCLSILKKANDVQYFFFGGYHEPERQILIVYPEYIDIEDIEMPIKAIQVIPDSKTAVIEHKDVLGAVIGLGLKREKIGDILVAENTASIILFRETAAYALMYLNNIGKTSVSCHEVPLDQLNIMSNDFKSIHITVASLRVDAVISGGLGVSRSNVNRYVKSGRLKINHKEIMSPTYMVKEGDLISVKGKGRMILEKVGGTTRKDRIKITLKKVL